jgi:hypothetical protein
MPFGGTKACGYGRFGRKVVINEFTMAAAKLAIEHALTDEVGKDHRTVNEAVTACFASTKMRQRR